MMDYIIFFKLYVFFLMEKGVGATLVFVHIKT